MSLRLTLSTYVTAFTLLFLMQIAHAGPDDPSKFDPVQYGAQKILYDWNYPTPEAGLRALGFVRNHIKALQEFGDLEKSDIVIVAHGNDLHAFSRLNKAAYPEAYSAFKELTDLGVKIHVCRNAARSRGYGPEDFYDVMTVVPAAVIDIAKWENEGYSYMYAELFPKITREEILEKHPEINLSQ
ncbi:MAG: hypothetical protein DHS20C01_36590 [marine bacterium B5-7]|nr:MAG: hypothetical protein DHS20C01_36590 [marine bacterium B5-7]